MSQNDPCTTFSVRSSKLGWTFTPQPFKVKLSQSACIPHHRHHHFRMQSANTITVPTASFSLSSPWSDPARPFFQALLQRCFLYSVLLDPSPTPSDEPGGTCVGVPGIGLLDVGPFGLTTRKRKTIRKRVCDIRRSSVLASGHWVRARPSTRLSGGRNSKEQLIDPESVERAYCHHRRVRMSSTRWEILFFTFNSPIIFLFVTRCTSHCRHWKTRPLGWVEDYPGLRSLEGRYRE